jgi:putative membrane protein insertion efficiency factor
MPILNAGLRVVRIVALLTLDVYRWCLSPLLSIVSGHMCKCRFYPSCSEYARICLNRHGLFRAAVLVIKRLSRCHPWCPGGDDPVP